MELDQKVRYALLALSIGSAILAGLALHAGVHMSVLEQGGRAD
jgi:hypothetical protein